MHASADEIVDGSERLIRWLKGTPVEPKERDEFGRVYEISLKRTPI